MGRSHRGIAWTPILIVAAVMCLMAGMFACGADPYNNRGPGNCHANSGKPQPNCPTSTPVPTATPTATPTPAPIPTHLFVYANDDYKNGAVDVPIQQVQGYASVLETQLHSSEGNDAACNPNKCFTNGGGAYQDADPWAKDYRGWSNARWPGSWNGLNPGQTPGPYATPIAPATPTAPPVILLQHYQARDFSDGPDCSTNADHPFDYYYQRISGTMPVGVGTGDKTGGLTETNAVQHAPTGAIALNNRIDKSVAGPYPFPTPVTSPCPIGGSGAANNAGDSFSLQEGQTAVQYALMGCIDGIEQANDNNTTQLNMGCPAVYNDARQFLHDNGHVGVQFITATSFTKTNPSDANGGLSDPQIVGGSNAATPGPGQKTVDSETKKFFDAAVHSTIEAGGGGPTPWPPPPWAQNGSPSGGTAQHWSEGLNQLQTGLSTSNVSPLATDNISSLPSTNGSTNLIWLQGELMFEQVNNQPTPGPPSYTPAPVDVTKQIAPTLNTASQVIDTPGSTMIMENHHVADYGCSAVLQPCFIGDADQVIGGTTYTAAPTYLTNMLDDELNYLGVFLLYYKLGTGAYPQAWFSLQIKANRLGGQCQGMSPNSVGNCQPMSVWPVEYFVPDDTTALETMSPYNVTYNQGAGHNGTGCSTLNAVKDAYGNHGAVDLLVDGNNGTSDSTTASTCGAGQNGKGALYARQFSTCWQWQGGDPLAPAGAMTNVGKCAILVNTRNANLTVPCTASVGGHAEVSNGIGDFSQYHHMAVLARTGPLAVGLAAPGGTAAWDGVAFTRANGPQDFNLQGASFSCDSGGGGTTIHGFTDYQALVAPFVLVLTT